MHTRLSETTADRDALRADLETARPEHAATIAQLRSQVDDLRGNSSRRRSSSRTTSDK